MYEYLDRRYALALYKIGEEKGKVLEYLRDLKDIVNIIENNKDLMHVIKYPNISLTKKKRIFTKIFKGKIDDELLSFLLILIEKDRILYIKQKLIEFEKIHLEKQNTLVAKVKTVIPLTKEERNKLNKKLQKKYNKNILFKEEIDKSIIGGVYVRIGDDVIDGTIKAKFEKIREHVFS